MSSVGINPPKTPVTKGSNGIATATVPNVCKMPGPPPPFVPTPLPNIGQSGKDPKGYSTTVKIEGHPVAIQGASFASTGDIASKSTGGGVVSNNVEGPCKLIAPGSLDVMIQGKRVHFLGDQTLNNGGPSGSPANSATLTGAVQKAIAAGVALAQVVACQCQKDEQPDRALPVEKQCEKLIDARGKCVTKKLAKKEAEGIWPNARFKPPTDRINPRTQRPVTRVVPDLVLTLAGEFPGASISVGKLSRARRQGLKPGKVIKVIDFKFPCPPSTREPFPGAAVDGKGYGIPINPGQKELDDYKRLSTPPKVVKVINPTAELCKD